MLLIQMVIIQVITFAALVFVLIKIMNHTSFSEIKRMKQLSEQNAQKANELNNKILEAQKQYKEKIDEATKEANRIKSKAQEDAQKQKEEALLLAKQEADRIIKQALNSKEKLKEELESNLRQKSIDQALRLIGQVLAPKQMVVLDQILVGDIIKDMDKIDVTRFKVDTDRASLMMANEIDRSQREEIVSLLCAKTGKNIVLEAVLDAGLIAGITIKLGNLVIDASLRGRLNEAWRGLRQ